MGAIVEYHLEVPIMPNEPDEKEHEQQETQQTEKETVDQLLDDLIQKDLKGKGEKRQK